MNSPYEDYYLEIIPYYNEDGMTPFSYIIPKSMEYFTATGEENDNNDNKSNNYAIAISDESSQSFKSDYKFLQDQNYLKSTFKSIIESDSFKQEYQKFETSTPFKTLFKTYITNFPKDSCSVSIFVNYSKTFVDNNLTSSVKEAFTSWWDANKSNNFILNTINNEKLQEPLEYFLNCFFFEDDAAKQVRKRLLCYIQKYISNNEYTKDNVLSYIQGFIDSLEYDSNGLKDITPCNCDETIDEATKQNMTSLIKTLQTVDAKSSSSTIWIIIAIVVVIIIIVVVVVIFMKKSKSKAVSATPESVALANAVRESARALANIGTAGRAIYDTPPSDPTRIV